MHSSLLYISTSHHDAESDGRSDSNLLCFTDGQQVIDFYGVSIDNVFLNFGILFVYFIVFRLFAFVALWIQSQRR